MNLQNMWSLAPEPLDPTQGERVEALIQRVATEVVRRRLTAPAVLVLESARPLCFLGSQALVFLDPLVRAFLNAPDYDLLVRILEDRSRVERLIEVIEDLEEARRPDDPSHQPDSAHPAPGREEARRSGPNGPPR